jgi:hypothetical protein
LKADGTYEQKPVGAYYVDYDNSGYYKIENASEDVKLILDQLPKFRINRAVIDEGDLPLLYSAT